MAADRVLSGPGAEGNAAQSPATGTGRLIGRRYRLMSPVGRGGMGMVWHAHDVLLDRAVAVKELILPFGLDHAGKQVAHRRMLREARSAARLTHPGIVTVHDVVEEDGRPWIVMELVRAWSLEQAVRQSGPLPVLQVAEIGIRVLDALRHAHAAGILHRDVKPGNVLLTSDRVVLTDFGIAAIEGDVTITQTGLLMGSPAYVPPERLSGQPITQAADLWSFGATLYAAVEGRPPYEGPDAIAVLGAVLTQEPTRPERAGGLLPVIEGLLRKNPAERLTAEQVGDALERVLHVHGSARPRTPDAPAPLPSRQDLPAGLPEAPSGPMPSRIVETPSGPVRVPYDPLEGQSDGYEGLSGAAAGPAERFDAFASASGPLRLPESPDGPHEPGRGPLTGPPGDHDHTTGGYPSRDLPSGAYPSQDRSSGAYPSRDLPSGTYPSHDLASGAYPSRDLPSGTYPSHDLPSGAYPSHDLTSGAYPSQDHASGAYPSHDLTAGANPSRDPSAGARPGPAGGSPFGASPGLRVVPDLPPDPPVSPGALPAPGRPGTAGSPPPILPLTTGSRAALWPLPSDDDLRNHSRDLSREVSGGRLAAPPSAGDRPAKGRRVPGEQGNGWVRDGRPTPRLIVTAVAAVSAVTAATVFFAFSGGDPAPQAGTPSASAEAPAQPLQAVAVPDGYKEHAAAGFTAAVPDGWKATTSGDEATFTGPKDSGVRFLVQQATPQPDGGLAELTRAEADGGVESYIQVRLQAAQFRTWKAADWEYTYTRSNGVPMHAMTRYVTIDDGTAFKITFDMPELAWDDQAEARKVFLDTFRQTT
ncbi:serine/threonine protein kinase [Nonomuraea muscovyensis]|uniref:non-specific serine/threonine protein kinase n=1 Tax=Nonomuraea muscovyensis TaxID=1124761 RepID=A0A7X0C9H0_9ACTN|nr:serine/threonine-protein kinase [Nonomuraea muscovyensis]MBB6349184.1 serine/threonine protein kinase [Nonomuraea muscovyensis]